MKDQSDSPWLLLASYALTIAILISSIVAHAIRFKILSIYTRLPADFDDDSTDSDIYLTFLLAQKSIYCERIILFISVLLNLAVAIFRMIIGKSGLTDILNLSIWATLAIPCICLTRNRSDITLNERLSSVAIIARVTALLSLFTLALEVAQIYDKDISFIIAAGYMAQSLLAFLLVIISIIVIKSTSSLNDLIADTNENLPKKSREKQASFLSSLFFSWFNEMLALGYKRPLTMQDLWDLDISDKTDSIRSHFSTKTGSLTSKIFQISRLLIFQQTSTLLISSLLVFCGPVFLSLIISFIQSPGDTPHWYFLAYVLGMFVCTLTRVIIEGQTYFTGRRIGLRIRAILISEISNKSLHRPFGFNNESKPLHGVIDDTVDKVGNALNMISVDVAKILEASCYIGYLVSSPLQVGISIGLLFFVLGYSAFGGIFVMLLFGPLGARMGYLISKSQSKLMKATDARIMKTNELLQSILIVKYFNWEKSFLKNLLDTRSKELTYLKKYIMTVVVSRLCWYYFILKMQRWTCPILVSLCTFTTYTLIAGKELDTTTAFTSLALFNTLRSPLQTFPDIVVRVIESYISLQRIENFLCAEELEKYNLESHGITQIFTSNNFNPSRISKSEQQNDIPIALGFENASFAWISECNNFDTEFRLQNLNIRFPSNELTVICGATGSGKSSLLLALLGEMKRTEGTRHFLSSTSHKSVAYVAQQAWLQNMSIRENILFGMEYDAQFYKKVINACALSKDLKSIPGGDAAEIGVKGSNLSGGQKQRIALARAVYSRRSTILLDDCLSAVDAPTARHIFQECILKLLKGRTCLLVTHAIQLCVPDSKYVVLLKSGHATIYGPTENVMKQVFQHFELSPKEATAQYSRQEAPAPIRAEMSISRQASAFFDEHGVHLSGGAFDIDSNVRLTNEEDRSVGSVKFSVYATYCKAAGGIPFFLLVILTLVIAQGMLNSSDLWLKTWAGAYSNSTLNEQLTVHSSFAYLFAAAQNTIFQSVDANYYVSIYASLGLGIVLSLLLRLCVLYSGGFKASKNLHQAILERILKAPMRFFDTTPIGRMINRDIQTIDQEIIGVSGDFLTNVVSAIFLISIITYVTPAFILSIIPVLIIYSRIASYYIKTSTELKRLDSISRSPIYSHFSEMVDGVCTIRAFAMESTFLHQSNSKIDNNHRAFFFLWVSNRWLNLRIDIIGAILSLCSGLAIYASFRINHTFDPGFAGLSLTYTMSFTDSLLWIVRFNALMEMSLNSVERVEEYLEIAQESDMDDTVVNGIEWNRGDIQFQSYSLKYSPELPSVLKNIKLHVKGGEKIGIVGRSGAGKRFVEATSGRILIDGVDISALGLSELRTSLIIIPQDPTLFSGTVRTNMDPFGKYSDYELMIALSRSHLQGSKSAEPSSPSSMPRQITLETQVLEGGSNFSQGQRQLLCLARALLKKSSRIIIMDEATASVDPETDARIQKTIREEFKNCTVLCIAHRLLTVIDYDRILVLDKGEVIEFGEPVDLLQLGVSKRKKDDRRIGPTGQFLSMCEETGELEQLLALIAQK